MSSSSHNRKHHKLVRRQRGGIVEEEEGVIIPAGPGRVSPPVAPAVPAIPPSGTTALLVSGAPPVPAVSPARGGRVAAVDDEDEDDDDTTLSSCSIACLNVYLGVDCRTVSCMCNSPSLPDANTCMAATCTTRDRSVFLTNIQSWCGAAQASALIVAGGRPASNLPSTVVSSTISLASTTALRSAANSLLSSGSLLSDGSLVSSTAVSAISTTRVPVASTTVLSSAVDEDALSTVITTTIRPSASNSNIPTSVNNPADTDADASSSSKDSDSSSAASNKSGLSTGAIAGIAIGFILAFAMIGLCVWKVRRNLMGRSKKAKDFLRKSDAGDWISADVATSGRGTGGGARGAGEKQEVEFDDDDEKAGMGRIDRAIQNRSSSIPGEPTVVTGIGARSMLASMQPSSNGMNSRSSNQHRSIQSQRAYEEMQAALAYPSQAHYPQASVANSHFSMTTNAGTPAYPYFTHPQHNSFNQQYGQHQRQQHASFIAANGAPLSAVPSMNSTAAAHLSHSGSAYHTPTSVGTPTHANAMMMAQSPDSPYPTSVTLDLSPDLPGTGDTAGMALSPNGAETALVSPMLGQQGYPSRPEEENDSNNSHVVTRQSIPFLPPSGHASSHHHMHSLSNASSSSGNIRNLTGSFGDNSSSSTFPSPSSLISTPALSAGNSSPQTMMHSSSPSTPPQRRATQLLASQIALPTSPPKRSASIPMPLPGTPTSLLPSLSTISASKIPENPFLETLADQNNEKVQRNSLERKESFEGLAYLSPRN